MSTATAAEPTALAVAIAKATKEKKEKATVATSTSTTNASKPAKAKKTPKSVDASSAMPIVPDSSNDASWSKMSGVDADAPAGNTVIKGELPAAEMSNTDLIKAHKDKRKAEVAADIAKNSVPLLEKNPAPSSTPIDMHAEYLQGQKELQNLIDSAPRDLDALLVDYDLETQEAQVHPDAVKQIKERLMSDAVRKAEEAVRLSSNKKGFLFNASEAGGHIRQINPTLIKVKPGYNPRDLNTPINQAHINRLAKSIATGGVEVPLTVSVEGDDIFLTDGECRLTAVMRAIEVYGAPIETIPCIQEPKGTDEAGRTLTPILRNEGMKLTPYELSTQIRKLVGFGWQTKKIADRCGMSVTRINQLLDMREMPSIVVDAVKTGMLSESQARKAAQTIHDRDEMAAVVDVAVKTAKAEGRTCVKPAGIESAKASVAASKGSTSSSKGAGGTSASPTSLASKATPSSLPNEPARQAKKELKEIFANVYYSSYESNGMTFVDFTLSEEAAWTVMELLGIDSFDPDSHKRAAK